MTPDEIRTATEDTRRWLERAVIGLNLCPFAKGVYTKQQVRYAVCMSDDPAVLLDDLRKELLHLADADPEQLDTTLLIAPRCLPDFLDFNDFLNEADALLQGLGLEGDYQGEILLNGQRIVGTSLNRGIVFQEHRLFPWLTVEKNVALGLLNSSLTEGQQRAKRFQHPRPSFAKWPGRGPCAAGAGGREQRLAAGIPCLSLAPFIAGGSSKLRGL